MLKHMELLTAFGEFKYQPPSGGCVLKPHWLTVRDAVMRQPPSGGCVLKPL